MTNPDTALIIIDMQKGMAGSAIGERNNPDAEQHVATLLQHWRDCKAPVVHVRHISRSPESPFWPGQKGVEFQEALQPLPTEHVVEKHIPDAFLQSGLERWLRIRNITQLVVVGVSTHISVESSARTASNLGFQVTVVPDATFAFAQTDYNGQHQSADTVHAMSLANLQGEFADIVHTRDLVA